MFLFKKIVSRFFFPLPLICALFCVGLLLLCFTKKQRLGKVLVSMGLAALLSFSYGPLPDALLIGLEREYKQFQPEHAAAKTQDIKYVVVLGGGHVSDPNLPLTGQLEAETLARLVEGLRIHRHYPGSKLILSGGKVYDPVAEATLMADLAEQLGVSKSDIIQEDQSADTEDEARIIKGMINKAPFALVTSASHMPRSMSLFRKLGMNPLPAPTEQNVKEQPYLTPDTFFPRTKNLRKTEKAAYEYLGIFWAKLRGQT